MATARRGRTGCFGWPPEAELVANEMIQLRSKRSCLGSAFPASWYKRQCQTGIFIASLALAGVGVALFFRLVLPRLSNSVWDKENEEPDFVAARCTTSAASNTGPMLSCRCSDVWSCTKTYPCYSLNVSFNIGNSVQQGWVSENKESLRQMQEANLLHRRCMVHRDDCFKEEPSDRVSDLTSRLNTSGTQFNCKYNPMDPSEIIYVKDNTNLEFIWLLIFALLVGVIFLVALIIPLCACVICGNQRPFSVSPPTHIQEEVCRREQVRGGAPLSTFGNFPGLSQPPPYQQAQSAHLQNYPTQSNGFSVGQDNNAFSDVSIQVGNHTSGEPPLPPTYIEANKGRPGFS